jgi:hypothetical protein
VHHISKKGNCLPRMNVDNLLNSIHGTPDPTEHQTSTRQQQVHVQGAGKEKSTSTLATSSNLALWAKPRIRRNRRIAKATAMVAGIAGLTPHQPPLLHTVCNCAAARLGLNVLLFNVSLP